jgi:hypothetical protein
VHDDLAEVLPQVAHGSVRDRLHTIALGAFRAARFAEIGDPSATACRPDESSCPNTDTKEHDEMDEQQLHLWTDANDGAGDWLTPPPAPTHDDAVLGFLAGVVALRAEMGDLLPQGVIEYARELRRATKDLTDEQRARATAQMRALHSSANGYRPRALLVAAITAALDPASPT